MKLLRPLLTLIIWTLFGCSDQTNKDDNSKQKQAAQSVKASRNKKSRKMITEQIIDSTPDDDLLQIVFDNLAEKLPADFEKEYRTVLSWNKARQVIYMIWILETEVNNGGFNQFYFNPGGQFSNLLPDALKLVGATQFANLTQQANDTYEKENDKIIKHQDGTLEGFSKSYDDNPLSEFDDKFYGIEKAENLQKLQVDYIRKHKADFVDK